MPIASMQTGIMQKTDMNAHRWIQGSSLLDQLTAVVVLSVGLLGLAGLQGRVQDNAANAENQTLALTLAQSQIERLRGLADIPGGVGYEKIVAHEAAINTVDGKRLDSPFALRVEVARYQLQPSPEADAVAQYRVVDGETPTRADSPEFKHVNVTLAWTSKSGVPHRVWLPALISRGTF
jgi:hypothetical protein